MKSLKKVGMHHTTQTVKIRVLQRQGSEWVAYDDITGLGLDASKVYEARCKEVAYVNDKEVWVKIPRSEATQRGWKVLKARWIDINKGDDKNPLLRSRFVGKEFNDGPMDGLFAGTPRSRHFVSS